MDSQSQLNSGCKSILSRKLSCAVIFSVFAQVIVLLTFLFIINFDVFEPVEWFRTVLQTLMSIGTWLYILPFAGIIFAQCIISAKNYVDKPVYNVSRIQKILSYFSLHNLVLLLLYMITGFLNIWLYLSLSGGKYQSLYSACKKDSYCLIEEYFFMILSGFWVGIYYFSKYSISEKQIQFPIIQQRKLVQFKASLLPLFDESRRLTTWPVLSYFLIYLLWGHKISRAFSESVGLIREDTGISIACYIYVWLFMVLYFFSMNLMSLFFKLFLTEAIEFPLVNSDEAFLTLNEAIGYTDLPIVQHLACLDLYLLSVWSPIRRNVYFSLSHPGGHPHIWNGLMENSLKVISEFMKTLNESVNCLLESPKKEQLKEAAPNETVTQSPIHSMYSSSLQSPNLLHCKYDNIRNMSLRYDEADDFVNITFTPPKLVFKELEIVKKAKELWHNFVVRLKKALGFDYLFGELPEENVHICLRNGQPIAWLVQALSHLAVASYSEDRYGIVQKDLTLLITTLVELKQCVDKLNKLGTLNRRSPAFKEHSVKMKHCISAAVKRSLFTICLKYKKYLNDLHLSKEVAQQLQFYKL